MKPYSNLHTIIIRFIFVWLCSSGCKKFIEIDAPKNTLVSNAVFADSIGATAAVKGIYVKMNTLGNVLLPANGEITVCAGLSADEIYPTTNSTSYSDEIDFYKNNIASNNSTNSGLWGLSYSYIYQANACIEGITASSSLSLSCKNQLLGEAKFLRALFYFNLINLYGPVPLIVNTANYQANAAASRTRVDNVYSQINDDLGSAQTLMSALYPSAGRLRPNRFTATALLSRAWLYQKQWDKAEASATQIINSGTYSLMSNLNNVFLPSSTEAIWQLIPLQLGYETTEGFFFIPSSASVLPKYVVSDYLLNAFETGDLRKTSWIKANTIGSQLYNYPNKYKLGRDFNSTPLEYYTVFRLTEQYLIRAEARAQLGNIAGAQSDLNIVRNRAGLPNTTALTQPDLLIAIYHERQVEFFSECGHRWYDLKRTGRVDAVMNIVTSTKGGSWKPESALYPVPQDQINLNPFLEQNPGY